MLPMGSEHAAQPVVWQAEIHQPPAVPPDKAVSPAGPQDPNLYNGDGHLSWQDCPELSE